MRKMYVYTYETIDLIDYRPGILEFYEDFSKPPVLIVSDDHLKYFLTESYFHDSQILEPFYFMYDVNEFLHQSRGRLLLTAKYYKTVQDAHEARKKRCLEVLPTLNFPMIPSFDDVEKEEREDYIASLRLLLTDKEMLLLRRILEFQPSKNNKTINHEYLFRGAGIETYDEYCLALESLNFAERKIYNPRRNWEEILNH